MDSKVLKEKIEKMLAVRKEQFDRSYEKANNVTITGAMENGYMLGVQKAIFDLEELLNFIDFMED